jgi:polyisoprenoid-binding protein YceI
MAAPNDPSGAHERRAPGLPPAGRYALDPPHTFVGFRARHKVVGIVRGRFDTTAGTVVVSSDPAQCSVDVSIDASSLSTQNAMRDADVKGPDFFDAARYPAVTYRGTGLRDAGGGRWFVDGTLTIRDVSKVVPLEFRFNGVAPVAPRSPARVGFHAQAAVQRAAFGMTRELLSEIGEASSEPDVWIEIDCEALKAEGAPGPGR